MNTLPSIDDLIQGVVDAIGDELLPNLGNPKAQATAVMAQSILAGVQQMLQVADANRVTDHNDMTRTLRALADDLGPVSGPIADRIRERAATLGQTPDLPSPPDREAQTAAHLELSRALEATIGDLDELQRAGESAADTALATLRAHLAPRYQRDAAAILVGEGMIGRG
ncbi:MAG: hypothetical protein P8N02_02160, partial [Actinomycetota bacterium]|jgi:hypothetical protein|nr:hypothetical protein [Actinomycetota bacterium]